MTKEGRNINPTFVLNLMLLPLRCRLRSEQRPSAPGRSWAEKPGVRRVCVASVPFKRRSRNPPEFPALYVSGAGLPSARCIMAAGAAAALAFLSQESRTRAGGVCGLRAPAPVTMDSFFFGIEKEGGEGSSGAVRGRPE